jgi:hypothetical protein
MRSGRNSHRSLVRRRQEPNELSNRKVRDLSWWPRCRKQPGDCLLRQILRPLISRSPLRLFSTTLRRSGSLVLIAPTIPHRYRPSRAKGRYRHCVTERVHIHQGRVVAKLARQPRATAPRSRACSPASSAGPLLRPHHTAIPPKRSHANPLGHDPQGPLCAAASAGTSQSLQWAAWGRRRASAFTFRSSRRHREAHGRPS